MQRANQGRRGLECESGSLARGTSGGRLPTGRCARATRSGRGHGSRRGRGPAAGSAAPGGGGGWKPETTLALGALTAARAMEAFVLMWAKAYAALDRRLFNVAVVS